jgi:hypothetical protein
MYSRRSLTGKEIQMKQQNATWMLQAPAMAAIAMLLIQPLRAEVIEKTKEMGGTAVHYKVVLPDGYDPAKAYPAILAFGGGPQTMNTVDNILNRNFRAEAEKRGYIVVAPAAPDDDLFFEDGDRIFPEFLKMILADYKIQDNKFHIAGSGRLADVWCRRAVHLRACRHSSVRLRWYSLCSCFVALRAE